MLLRAWSTFFVVLSSSATLLLASSSVDSAADIGKCEGTQKEVVGCDNGPCDPVTCQDCEWSEWGEWGPCTCVGLQERHRSISVRNNECGNTCEGPKVETRSCDDAPCFKAPIDCVLSQWTEFSVCSKDCGGGQKTRERKVDIPLAHGGKPCEGLLKETKSCNTASCEVKVDASLSEWGYWSTCSKSCDGGQQSRERVISESSKGGGTPVESSTLMETRACNEQACEGPKDCEWGEWDSWSACSKSCDGGEKSRSRLIVTTPRNGGKLCAPKDMAEIASCNSQSCEDPVDCELGYWSAWEDCSCSCNGVQQRARMISVYPAKNGKACSGSLKEVRSCNEDACIPTTPAPETPIDGVLSYWSSWTECSASCASGLQTRQRLVSQHPENGGKAPPEGDLKEVRGCNENIPCEEPEKSHKEDAVDCASSEWDSWGACSVSCGSGQKVRQRQITQMANRWGKPCSQHMSMEVAPCSMKACFSVDCEWGEWSDWAACTCTGLQERHRQIAVHDKGVGKPCEGPKIETKTCSPEYCDKEPVDAVLEEWGYWSSCDKECGGGQQYRTRGILSESKYGGTPIGDKSLKEIKACNVNIPCIEAVDCVLGSWDSWSSCSATCDGGQQFRHRKIYTPASGGGKPCIDPLSEVRGCGTEHCIGMVDCQWGEWSDFGACSSTCGGGMKSRNRAIEISPRGGGKLCEALTKTEVIPCNTHSCDRHCVDALWGTWSWWSDCSASCGTGYQMKSRKVEVSPNHCGKGLEGKAQAFRECNTQSCEAEVVDCSFSEWTSFGECSSECNGIQERSRRITTYAQGKHAKICEGALKEVHPCNTEAEGYSCGPEPIDCVLSEWSSYTSCSAECGGGIQTRNREVYTPPRNGGKICKGTLSEVKGCNLNSCDNKVDCQWGEWESWDYCSKDCGGGEKKRFRHISIMPKSGGIPCDYKSSAEIKPCNEHICGEPTYCGWGEWSSFSTCSTSCGVGLQERERTLQLTTTKPFTKDDDRDGFVILNSLFSLSSFSTAKSSSSTFFLFCGGAFLTSVAIINVVFNNRGFLSRRGVDSVIRQEDDIEFERIQQSRMQQFVEDPIE